MIANQRFVQIATGFQPLWIIGQITHFFFPTKTEVLNCMLIKPQTDVKLEIYYPQAEQESEENTRTSYGSGADSSSIHFRYVCAVKQI